MQPVRVLTGITTSGTPHLGNYVGAIRPTVRASRLAEVESFYFLADYHALIKTGGDPARVQRSTLEIAATWLACGLDPDKVFFYRQSDIPEIPDSAPEKWIKMGFNTCRIGLSCNGVKELFLKNIPTQESLTIKIEKIDEYFLIRAKNKNSLLEFKTKYPLLCGPSVYMSTHE